MSVDAEIFAALSSLAGGRIFPDIAPEGTPLPYVTFQQVGGDAVNYLDGSAPGKRNARIQVNVWAETRSSASQLSDQVEDAMRAAHGLQTEVLGARASLYESAKLRGARQDFSVWY
jgi:hypothetical protein